jgi:magnesium transporter
MTVTIQALRVARPTVSWYFGALRREVPTAVMLGAACGTMVGAIAWFWRGDLMAAFAIGASILFSITLACVVGLSIPSLLHALRLDPKIAAGPVTLALTDMVTLLLYFSLGTVLLRGGAGS